MCGIVGYFGDESPEEVIMKGLKALEYRGYDSAGIAILNSTGIERVRAEGHLGNLEAKLSGHKFEGRLGIGHTRWATHGPPIERNAHPHVALGTSIVHNGIIENYTELKKELNQKGVEFSSDTDSELIAHLISHEVESGRDLLAAVVACLPKLRGAYSVLAMNDKYPDQLVAFKDGPPLLFGTDGQQTVIASDLQAILPYIQDIVFLEDKEIVVSQGTSCQTFNHLGKPIKKKSQHIEWNEELTEKQGFSHYMLKEIFEQPRAVASAIDQHLDVENHTIQLNRLGFGHSPVSEIAKLDREADLKNTEKILSEIERIFVVACGTSFYAGLYGEYIVERMSKVPVECDLASEFRYRHPVIPKNSLVICISQSGETADTLAALRLARESEAQILSICNVQNSTIDREADGHIYMKAGVEIGVASTKAFSSTLALMMVLGGAIAKSRNLLSTDEEQAFVKSLLAAPSHMETVLAYDKFFEEAAETLKEFRGFLYMGRGIHYPLALEGALKMKELAYMHAEGYAAGEMKHGPLALIDESMAIVMIAPLDELFEKTLSNLEEAKARGGKIIAIGTAQHEKLKSLSDHYLALPEVDSLINPLLEVIPLQLMSFHVAKSLGHDVDKPRNLAKSVTVE